MSLTNTHLFVFFGQIFFIVLAYLFARKLKLNTSEQNFLWFSVIWIVFFSMGLLAPGYIYWTAYAVPVAIMFPVWLIVRRLKSKLSK